MPWLWYMAEHEINFFRNGALKYTNLVVDRLKQLSATTRITATGEQHNNENNSLIHGLFMVFQQNFTT